MANPVIVFFDPNHSSNLLGSEYRVPVAYGWDLQCRALNDDEWFSIIVLNDMKKVVPPFRRNLSEPIYIVGHANSIYYSDTNDIALKLHHEPSLLIFLDEFSHGGSGGADDLYKQVSALASGARADLVKDFISSRLTQTDLMRVLRVRLLLQRISVDPILAVGGADTQWLEACRQVKRFNQIPHYLDIEAFQERRLCDCIRAMNSFWIQLTANLP